MAADRAAERIEPGVWHRLHPLSPFVRAGRAAIALAVVLVPALVSGRDFFGSLVDLAILGVVVLLGFVSWLVTRWQVENQELRIETGLIRRSSQRYPLAQVQAIDVIEPGLGRAVRARRAAAADGRRHRRQRAARVRARRARRRACASRLLALAKGAAVAEPRRRRPTSAC